MSHVVISAKPAAGYWHLGRKWGHTPESFEVVDQPADEAVAENDSFEEKQAKQKKAHARVSDGKLTKREIEIINRDHLHGLALAEPKGDSEEVKALKERVAELEALLADATAPKKSKAEAPKLEEKKPEQKSEK